CFLYGHTGLETPHDIRHLAAQIGIGSDLVRIETKGQPRVNPRPAESGRHHTYQHSRNTVESKALPDDAGIAVEMLTPELGADHENRCGARLDIVLRRQATKQRLHAEEFERIGAEETAVELVCAAAGGIYQRCSAKAAELTAQVLEDVVVLPII